MRFVFLALLAGSLLLVFVWSGLTLRQSGETVVAMFLFSYGMTCAKFRSWRI